MSTHRIPCQTFGQLHQTPGTSLSLDWWLVSLPDQSVDPTNHILIIYSLIPCHNALQWHRFNLKSGLKSIIPSQNLFITFVITFKCNNYSCNNYRYSWVTKLFLRFIFPRFGYFTNWINACQHKGSGSQKRQKEEI